MSKINQWPPVICMMKTRSSSSSCLYLEITMSEFGRAKPEVLDMFCQLHVINAVQGSGVEDSAIYRGESIGAQFWRMLCCSAREI
jgi:hypothetical protein